MRLINTSTLEFHEFYPSETPRYAILSHVWGDGEVTFRDMSLPNRSLKKGYVKVTQACRMALEHGLGFVWVDTCCIDKSSSAELTESINSMFQWYMNAAVCFAFLEDLLPTTPTEDGLGRCRWFTRGWTLQELLAPREVKLYDVNWNYRGSKLDFIDTISNSTGIPEHVLREHEALASCSIAMKMSWAARRQTTRVEDVGYCLLGIFDVNMPLIYGEGLKAFRRLQEEIIKRNNDMTIFAWDVSQSHEQHFLGLFATSPTAFIDSSGVMPFADDFPNLSITNKGILVSGDVPLRIADVSREGGGRELLRYFLCLGLHTHSYPRYVGIYLRKVGPRLFYRDGRFALTGIGENRVYQIGLFDPTDYYILTDPTTANTISSSTFRDHAIHVPLNDVFRLVEVVPETLWDIEDRVCLRPKPYPWVRYPMAIAIAFRGELAGSEVRLVVLCDCRTREPICRVFEWGQYRHQAAMIFKGRQRSESIYWADLEIQAPQIFHLSDCVEIRVGNQVFSIIVSLKKEIVESISTKVELHSLNLNITRHPDNT
ncbi:MAG: hypothetical protein M1813_009311 [Trichoglossum hirsutum]|nr:MAG: hypothetical protein M1813_009311 [Trichoglossum hirsutum]